MDLKRVSIGTVVGIVAIFLLGRIIWGFLFEDFFAANAGSAVGVDREERIWWSVIVGYAFYGLAINLGLELGQGASNVTRGLLVGAVTGALIWGTADFVLYGSNNVSNLTATIADTILESVRGAITGAIVVLVLSFVGGKRSTA